MRVPRLSLRRALPLVACALPLVAWSIPTVVSAGVPDTAALSSANVAPAPGGATTRSAPDIAPAPTMNIEHLRRWTRQYMDFYYSPKNSLVYNWRVSSPAGTSHMESPAEVKAGRVKGTTRPWGYGAGIEDTAYMNGTLLFALCEAHDATQDPYFAEVAGKIVRGMFLMSTVSPVKGFVPRGPHPDDPTAYYADSSVDQHTLFLAGLWRYSHSTLASDEDRKRIKLIAHDVAARMERNNWSIKSEDDSVDAHAGGSLRGDYPTTVASLLYVVAVAWDLTRDPHWKQVYEQLGAENDRWGKLERDPANTGFEPRYNIFNNQDMFRTEILRRIETDPRRKQILQGRLQRWARDMMTGPSLRLWRSSFSTDRNLKADAIVTRKLAVLREYGIELAPDATAMDVWRMFSNDRLRAKTDGRHAEYMEMSLTIPTMVWQIVLLSQEPSLRPEALGGFVRLVTEVDPLLIQSGWTANYSAVGALMSIAKPAP